MLGTGYSTAGFLAFVLTLGSRGDVIAGPVVVPNGPTFHETTTVDVQGLPVLTTSDLQGRIDQGIAATRAGKLHNLRSRTLVVTLPLPQSLR